MPLDRPPRIATILALAFEKERQLRPPLVKATRSETTQHTLTFACMAQLMPGIDATKGAD